ncbi:MAG: 30S ribosomal protein S6 [Clostridia bacterium]|nr:30S ribosomal protein S6 [Clostridia bacterium]
MKYEVLYILNASLGEEEINAQTEKFADIVKKSGGEVEKVDKWGVKRFAYPINFKNEGFYVLMTYTANPDVPKEVERQMGISDSVYRYMTTKAF